MSERDQLAFCHTKRKQVTDLQQQVRVYSASPHPRAPEADQAELGNPVANQRMLDGYLVSEENLVAGGRYIQKLIAQIEVGVGLDPYPVVASRLRDMVPY